MRKHGKLCKMVVCGIPDTPRLIASFSEGSRNGNAQEEINSEPFDPEQLLWFHSATEAGGVGIRARFPSGPLGRRGGLARPLWGGFFAPLHGLIPWQLMRPVLPSRVRANGA